jgi:hypothetical protein
MERNGRHPGRSLLEILVAIAIVGLLIGFVANAIQSTRAAAVRVQSSNNLRQIILGVHQYADQQSGQITGLTKTVLPKKFLYTEQSLWWVILPWTYGQRTISGDSTHEQMAEFFHPVVKVYQSPGDPTFNINPVMIGTPARCSYVLNMMAIDGGLSIPFTFQDGTGSTICVSESYYYKPSPEFFYSYTYIFGPPIPAEPYGRRRATFADAGWNDAVPVTVNNRTTCSVPGLTFQVNPALESLDHRIPQTPFAAGLPVAMFDGSVRTLSPRIAETVFWSLVTPAGGEVVGEF